MLSCNMHAVGNLTFGYASPGNIICTLILPGDKANTNIGTLIMSIMVSHCNSLYLCTKILELMEVWVVISV